MGIMGMVRRDRSTCTEPLAGCGIITEQPKTPSGVAIRVRGI